MGSGLLSIINATVPFFTALIGFAVFGQRLSSLSLFGMAVGFSGVIVLVFDPDAINLAEGGLLAVSAALCACFLYRMALNRVKADSGIRFGNYYRQSAVFLCAAGAIFNAVIAG